VALKVMVAAIADDPELKKRFEREAKAVAKMTHPNVVMVFDLGYHTDGSPFLAMELLKGNDLQKAMREPPPMSLERKVAIILQVLAGLSHAHQAGIVHRDIKPANIFINLDGSVKIMDFGVARLTTASMTGTGNIVGTADYMSPEQVKGAKVDGRSDVFSVGCMLYELLTGRRPFHSDNLMAIFYKITHEEPSFDLIPAGPQYDALLPLLKKSLAKNLEDRYQTAYEFAVDLQEYLKTHSTSASGEHALAEVGELAPPPPGPPPSLTDPGGTDVGGETEITAATMDIGPVAQSQAPTSGRPGEGVAPTVVQGQAPTVLGGAPTARAPVAAPRPTPQYPPRMGPRPIPEKSGSPVLYIVLGGMGVALLGLGGYIFLQRQAPQPPPTTLAAVPTTLAPAPTTLAPTPAPPPPTPEPAPTFKQTVGKGAAAARAAQSAFGTQDYGTAIAKAQESLKADPQNSEAQRILESALNGQKAETRFGAARSALSQGDYAKALSEAEAGRQLAPWDSRGPSLVSQVQQAQARAAREAEQQEQQARVAQVNTLLGQAETAFNSQKYDAAIALYDEVLKLDPQNQRAGIGKANALGAKAMAQAASTSPQTAGRSFVAGKTQASSSQTKSGSLPPGFEETPGVVVKKGTQAAELPGKVDFDITPDSPKAGEKYTVQINFANDGAAPIQIASMIVTTTINGKKRSGPVPPQAKVVAPRQTAQLLLLPDFWKDDTTSWSMEVIVRTTRGETYRNQVEWQ
jgi:serine/threonine-protein kinase